MVEQGDDAVADQARGRVVAGDDQLEQAGQQLLVAQPVAVFSRREQDAHEIVAGGVTFRVDEVLQVADDAVRRGDGLGWRVPGPRRQQRLEPPVQHAPIH